MNIFNFDVWGYLENPAYLCMIRFLELIQFIDALAGIDVE